MILFECSFTENGDYLVLSGPSWTTAYSSGRYQIAHHSTNLAWDSIRYARKKSPFCECEVLSDPFLIERVSVQSVSGYKRKNLFLCHLNFAIELTPVWRGQRDDLTRNKQLLKYRLFPHIMIAILVKDSVQFINFFWRTGFLRIFGVKIRNDKMHLNVCQLKSFLLACLSEFLSRFLFESRIVVDPPTAKANWFPFFFFNSCALPGAWKEGTHENQ